jgi:aspartate aminotransferase-like enzyme
METSPDALFEVREFVGRQNASKLLFTAGPASLLTENLTGLAPCFGRGDAEYLAAEERVLNQLKAMSGHSHIARLSGAASTALEVLAWNFLHGRVLVVQSGYYSERLETLALIAQRQVREIQCVDAVDWTEMSSVSGSYDWVWACSTETSRGLKIPMRDVGALAARVGARIALDATASIGLEAGHETAAVLAYSSCKGLFGLTGGAFLAFNALPGHAVDSFYLNLGTHLDRKTTGPYHAMLSLARVLPDHAYFRESVVINKERFSREHAPWLSFGPVHQPLLCTHVRGVISSKNPRAILYAPRLQSGGSVVCHLGEAHLGATAKGDILSVLEHQPPP